MTDITEIGANEIAESARRAAGEAAEYTKAMEEACMEEAPASDGSSTRYTLDYALEQLEKVRNESSLFAAQTAEKIMEIQSGGRGDLGAQSKGLALKGLVEEQGEVYRQLVGFYIEMISDLKKETPQANSQRQQFLEFVTDSVSVNGPGGPLSDFERIWKVINS